ncbi:hypothetical protein B0H67DRAFT_644390 [Lasiosphaeris hirsuta]|uniref:Oxidase ustYa n=1 Tax=Lasiosphaeris hirsuta TaxID=260670 RepID=A0AA40AEW2_9PEZI|nr:hypothetical protein B0H67DRAFT_644390 [Lasiosphaeris hirsuta]
MSPIQSPKYFHLGGAPLAQPPPPPPPRPNAEPDIGSDSLTDWDSGQDEHGAAWSDEDVHGQPLVRRRRKMRAKRVREAAASLWWVLDTVLLLVILGLLLERRGRDGGRWEFAGDLSGFAPRFSQQVTSFVPDPGFVPENGSEFFTREVREKWLSIVPKGLGYVQINDTSGYDNLPRPLLFYPNSTFTTSMTHQIHCLHNIVSVVAALTSNQPDMMPVEGAWHLSHCFDYLRQSIMCCGDVALEGQQTTFPEGWKGSDGWDAKHVCKDYGQVISYLEDNSADEDVWI